MATTILYHNGAYNIYTSICDAVYFEPAITLDELKEYYKDEYGNQGVRELEDRLERAHKTGTSNRLGDTLEDYCKSLKHDVDMKPIGRLSYDEFILKYLTLSNKEA